MQKNSWTRLIDDWSWAYCVQRRDGRAAPPLAGDAGPQSAHPAAKGKDAVASAAA